jgi:PAS domain S-box-containing protein
MQAGMAIIGTHDWALVAMSVLIAMAASYTALDLAGRVRASQGGARRLWLGTAALAMGGGIWAMHFVAMLAFSMPGMEVRYDPWLTALSLAVAIVATGASFAVIARARASAVALGGAGLLMGLGVVAMHYIGMAAMRMPAALAYDRLWVAASVLIAIGAATSALWLAARQARPVQRVAAGAVMGIAISGMHYAGMRAASFTAAAQHRAAAGAASAGQTGLALAVFSAALVILFLALVAAMFDRRFALMAEREATALRASEERFRSLYRRTPLPLHSLDPDGRIEQVSDTWLDLLGFAREEVVGRSIFGFFVEESAAAARDLDWPELIANGSLPPREYRMATRTGQFLDVVASAKVERDGQNRIIHVLGGLTDVTERKRAEGALRQAQKIEAMGQLTGGVAHDFNNLLAVVIGNLDLVRRRAALDPRSERLVESALEGARRGAALTQRLLAFARRQDLRPEPVDVPQLVRGMAELLQRSLGPMVRVETRFPLSLPPARADAHQLEMALLNLAVNARDAMPGGGVLDISADEDRLLHGNALDLAPGQYVRLALADSGSGMDEKTLARATEPFFTTKGIGKGTGLGLPMVQGLAAQSGGRLVLRSTPGRGTVAELFLPVAEQAAVPRTGAAEAPLEESPAASPLSILAVDDDPLVLANTVAMLEDLGHRVSPAVSGADALAQMEAGAAFDLLITDQLMPGMTGAELAAQVRARHPELAVLLVSGFADFRPEEGVDLPLLGKPFTQSALAAAIRPLTQGARVVPIRGRRAV